MNEQMVTFFIVAALLTISPGADTMLVIRNVISSNVRRGLLTTTGICSGLFFHAALSALGVSVILVKSAAAFYVLKTAGALYLCWLGIQSLRKAFQKEGNPTSFEDNKKSRVRFKKSFLEGWLNNVLNPKTAVFYFAFLPQFINPGDPVLAKSIGLAGIHCVMSFIWLSFIVFSVHSVRLLFIRPVFRRTLEGLSGGVLISLGIKLAFESR
ncbi:MAG: LysE family translocator [Flexistipes sinusarabici]|uniref:LysE family translocator n=2 Tax=Flexistipes sinusarabici TaxID=2352 RepID=A0A5D0MPS9_FLESI|nr:MAG: LysE family translocator [Flexistipes sinusarabici]